MSGAAKVHPFIDKAAIARRVDNWSTPPWLLEVLFPDGRYFDPCPLNKTLDAHDGAGLDLAWPTDRPVFINPPYSNVLPWVLRAVDHPGPIVLLVRDDSSTSWWRYAAVGGFRVTRIGQRIRFGTSKVPASFPSALWRRGA